MHQKDEKIKNLQPNQNTSTEKHEEDDDSLIPWNKYILMPKMYKPLLIVVVSAMFVVGPGSHGVTQYLQYVLYGFNLSDHYNILLVQYSILISHSYGYEKNQLDPFDKYTHIHKRCYKDRVILFK